MREIDTTGSIGFSEEQAELLDVATSFCRDKSPVERVRALIKDELGHDPAVWREIADLGWTGIAVPEEFGGSGLGLAETVPVMEQMGRNLMATPFLSTTLAAQVILAGGNEEQKSRVLPEICGGAAATVALMEPHGDWDVTHIDCTAKRDGATIRLSGRKSFVLDAAAASWIVVSVRLDGAPALVLMERAALPADALRREAVIDETRRSFQLTLDGVSLPVSALMDMSKAEAALRHAELVASLLLAAEACGGTASVINYTVEYLNTRKQFGRLIGSYQALKHPIVDAHVAYEQGRSHLYAAAFSFARQGEGEIATRMAKAQTIDAFSFASDRAIQFHGGFGFTYDCDAQLYRRRAIWSASQYGDALYHRRKLAALLF
jgi:alkylation response protein AidB-like acyl-CoA dehydrogenase